MCPIVRSYLLPFLNISYKVYKSATPNSLSCQCMTWTFLLSTNKVLIKQKTASCYKKTFPSLGTMTADLSSFKLGRGRATWAHILTYAQEEATHITSSLHLHEECSSHLQNTRFSINKCSSSAAALNIKATVCPNLGSGTVLGMQFDCFDFTVEFELDS